MLTGIPRETQVYLTQHGLFSLARSMTADREFIAVPNQLVKHRVSPLQWF